MRGIATIITVIMIMGMASAGTVTLTGTCSQSIINKTNNYTTFSLLNSGNETASNITIVPRIYGAMTYNSEETMQYLSPGQNKTASFYFYNFSIPGSYSDAFIVDYSQGGSIFYALFPCIQSIENATHSLVSISDVNQTGNTLRLDVVNLGQSQVNVNVSTLLPPSFSSVPESANITIGPNSQKNVSFDLFYPGISEAAYSIGLSASYIGNGMHYSVLYPFVIDFYSTKKISGPSIIFIIAGLIIIVMIALIIISVVKNRKKGNQTSEKEAVRE